MQQARMLIGYCPQENPILDLLTAKEHLHLFSVIKGIPPEHREELINLTIHEMNLDKYADIPAGTYSGGNKRKLVVAIAMIGNPPVVFLDEPSNGMDPEARRFMWKVISNVTNSGRDTAVIMVTQFMDEAEALSNKIAIMTEGRFRVFGGLADLKKKYGKGFEIEIKLVPQT
jgi:ATP-binding cassette subfamily A (ABC1) protein 3